MRGFMDLSEQGKHLGRLLRVTCICMQRFLIFCSKRKHTEKLDARILVTSKLSLFSFFRPFLKNDARPSSRYKAKNSRAENYQNSLNNILGKSWLRPTSLLGMIVEKCAPNANSSRSKLFVSCQFVIYSSN